MLTDVAKEGARAAGKNAGGHLEDEGRTPVWPVWQQSWMRWGSTFFLYGLIAWLLSEDARPATGGFTGRGVSAAWGWRACVTQGNKEGFGVVLRNHLLCSPAHSANFLIDASFMIFGPSWRDSQQHCVTYYVDAPMG